MSQWTQLGFQDRISTIREEFSYFHDFANLILLFIIVVVLRFIIKITIANFTNKNLIQGHVLELIWTLVPGLILVQLALPSLVLLYTLEESNSPTNLTIKVLGHQWYWSYRFPEIHQNSIDFDCYIVPASDQRQNSFRLLETDNIVSLPYLLTTRLLVSSRDVLHSWTIPALGVKADATPGRLNQLFLSSHLPGIYFGQCSEICGANHRFIPIIIQFLSFDSWISTT